MLWHTAGKGEWLPSLANRHPPIFSAPSSLPPIPPSPAKLEETLAQAGTGSGLLDLCHVGWAVVLTVRTLLAPPPQGVDLVLNSLAEEKLQASVRCLAQHGRFLEIGKFDLSNNHPLGEAGQQAGWAGGLLGRAGVHRVGCQLSGEAATCPPVQAWPSS